MKHQETWEETSLALAVENDVLKERLIQLVNSLPKNVSRYHDQIWNALSSCGFSDYEIEMYFDGNLILGDTHD